MGLAETKLAARKALHKGLSVPAVWRSGQTAATENLSVRLHNKIQREGGLGGDGYAELLATLDRAIFSRDELAEKNITLEQGDFIKFGSLYQNAEYQLDVAELSDGPFEEIWQLARTA